VPHAGQEEADQVTRFTTPTKASSVPFEPNGVYYGIVKRTDPATKRIWIEVPRLTPGFDYGPVSVVGETLPKPGDRVAAMFVENRTDTMVVLGEFASSTTPTYRLPTSTPANARPTNPDVGQIVTDADTGVVFYWNGSAWQAVVGLPPGGAVNSIILKTGAADYVSAWRSLAGTANQIDFTFGPSAVTLALAPNVTITGTMTAGSFSGNGAALTNLDAGNLATGTVASARLSGSYTAITGVGALTAGSIGVGFGAINIGTSIFTGNGSGLTTLNATNLASGTVPAARMPAFTGDATSTAGATALTLATVNTNVGSFGTASLIPVVTVDGKGRVTAVSTVAVAAAAAGTLTGTTLAANVVNSSLTGVGALTAGSIGTGFGNVNIGTSIFTGNGSGLTTLNATNLASGTVPAARMPAYTGDATSVAGATALTLATVNANTGTFGSGTAIPVVTVNAKGLVTAVSTTAVSTDASTISNATAKAAAFVATTANITLSGTQTIDGVAVVAGNRILVKNQTTASQNGVYVVAAGAWTRATDMTNATDVAGALISVQRGTANGGKVFNTTFRATDTLGTTAMGWFENFSQANDFLDLTRNTTAGYGGIAFGGSATATNNWHITSDGDGNLTFWNGNNGAGTNRMRLGSGGVLATASTITIGVDGTATAGIEVGPTQIGASTGQSFLDFHTGRNLDHDVRLLATGGSTTAGAGTLTITAVSVNAARFGLTGGSGYLGVWPGGSTYTGVMYGASAYVAMSDGSNTFISTPNASGTVNIRAGLNDSSHQLSISTTGTHTITGTLQAGIFRSSSGAAGEKFRVGDDVTLQDVNVANTMGVYGLSDSRRGNIRLGTGLTRIGGDENKLFILDATLPALASGFLDLVWRSSDAVVAYASSSLKGKQDIRPLPEEDWQKVYDLCPVRFAWKDEPETETLGFIAEEVGEAFPEAAVSIDFGDGPSWEAINWRAIIPALVAAVQHQRDELDQFGSRLDALEAGLRL
jgi:hypothetical protein